ncbi:cation transporter [Oceanithermus sp.]|uniref:CopZ family metallochaperone n=1 Tax=Oceanithermus sp. TaxID=2268145 RepID=UPI0025DFBAD1|nr:cation transporter [Oceanithermus sp.]
METRLKIEGMSCGHCVAAVHRALAAVPGVEEVLEVSLERGEARLRGAVDFERLRAAVEAEGYRVVAPG